jgi:hypothetical protein
LLHNGPSVDATLVLSEDGSVVLGSIEPSVRGWLAEDLTGVYDVLTFREVIPDEIFPAGRMHARLRLVPLAFVPSK